MGTTLTGSSINTTYNGLLKIADNTALSSTLKSLSDGEGNETGIQVAKDFDDLTTVIKSDDFGSNKLEVGVAGTNFTGNVDFTSATVTGLGYANTTYDLVSAQDGANVDITLIGSDASVDNVQLTAGTNITLTENAGSITIDAAGGGGAAGLVTGGQTNSMKSAAALTTLPATTLNVNDIAIGENAAITTTTPNLYSDGGAIAIGKDANVVKTIDYSFGNDEGGIAIGMNSEARMQLPSSGAGGIAVGSDTVAAGGNIAIGYASQSNGASGSVSIGWNSKSNQANATAVGKSANASGYNSVAIGESARASGSGFRTGAIAIGANPLASASNSIAIGNGSTANQTGAVVIGDGITTSVVDTVSVKALETQTDSTPTAGGIIMSDAGGTDRRINIDASGSLQIDSTVVGEKVFFTTGKVVDTNYIANDIVLSTVTIPANTFTNGDVFRIRSMEERNGINQFQYSSTWISSSPQTVGNSPTGASNYSFGQIQSSNSGVGVIGRTVYVQATETNVLNESFGNNDESENYYNNAVMNAYAIDWTINQYVYVQMWSDATAGTFTNYGAVVEKVN